MNYIEASKKMLEYANSLSNINDKQIAHTLYEILDDQEEIDGETIYFEFLLAGACIDLSDHGIDIELMNTYLKFLINAGLCEEISQLTFLMFDGNIIDMNDASKKCSRSIHKLIYEDENE